MAPPDPPTVSQPPAVMPQPDDRAPSLGACLRKLRSDRGLSISAVSAVTGIAKSTLSRVENDRLSLTYSKLLQLSKGLQIDVGELFAASALPDPARSAARRTFSLPGKGRTVILGAHVHSYLCAEMAGKKMTPVSTTIRARTLREAKGLTTGVGEEFAFVLAGRLALHTEFYEPLILEVGGSVYFDSTMGHAYLSAGSAPLQLLRVTTAPSQTPDPGSHS